MRRGCVNFTWTEGRHPGAPSPEQRGAPVTAAVHAALKGTDAALIRSSPAVARSVTRPRTRRHGAPYGTRGANRPRLQLPGHWAAQRARHGARSSQGIDATLVRASPAVACSVARLRTRRTGAMSCAELLRKDQGARLHASVEGRRDSVDLGLGLSHRRLELCGHAACHTCAICVFLSGVRSARNRYAGLRTAALSVAV
eukprot:TRINITY_DN6744_c0_g2_i1.p1 TRINITY_DN6744_c0_g2~~TRINITY_DN6744_c0_g2_i1.p1  ORF type:complete len:199 (-),score=20.80 TRINITY_DN6744_c0_g2_i1:406-1002(-)